jgi:hypothetical protein
MCNPITTPKCRIKIPATGVTPRLVLPTMKSRKDTRKKVQFKAKTYVVDIQSHHSFSSTERNSVWYNKKEFRTFQLDEKRELLSGFPIERKEQSRRTRQIDNVRSVVLEAQSLQRKQQEGTTSIPASYDNNCKRLAEFYKLQSESCAIAARQRGLESDLELININRVREASSMLLKRSALFKTLTISKGNTNYTSENNNARWSPVIDEEQQSSLPSISKKLIDNNDVSANKIKSSRMLRLELCKDFDLKSTSMIHSTSTIKSIDSLPPNKQRQDQRWSASNPSKNSRRKVSKRDIPLKPLKHSITPPLLSSMMNM